MMSDPSDIEGLFARAKAGEERALSDLFNVYREQLRRMVHLRLDRRLQGSIDPSEVLQETYREFARELQNYSKESGQPFFLWLRQIVGQKLINLHRQHLGANLPNANQEVSLYRGALPQASPVSLAALLLGRMTSASRLDMRTQTQLRVQEALNGMDPMDREVLTLRHFEMLTSQEAAQVLGIKKSAASNRYINALKRLKEMVGGIPGWG
ncbi:MAG: sigma-70 family RNA polymerase sigma factor [Gemmataceae bacterium]